RHIMIELDLQLRHFKKPTRKIIATQLHLSFLFKKQSLGCLQKDLLKQEIGTDKSDIELGIERFPEDIADPKQTISNAISIARKNITKRRRKDLSIADLYLPIGQNLELKKLESLPSYLDFKENIRIAFQYLNVV
ncbi:MAG: hypothetical protein ACI81T_004435, partial [Bacteroidia bacterium]